MKRMKREHLFFHFAFSSTVEPPLKEDSSVPVVSYGNNPVLVQASAAVNLMCNERQGRFLVVSI